MGYKGNLTEYLIIERFKKGEISISEAFNALTNGPDKIEYLNKREKLILIERDYDTGPVVNKTDTGKEENLDRLLKEMDSLIGLKTVKKTIKEYIAYIKVQELRKKFSLKSSPVVMHMIFKGNPGPGKTTVARIIARIFKEIGFLNEGEIIEAERADLVGEYIGHTAQKTRKLIQKAIGGVLFVDEAYSLARGGEKDFGKEAIDTMVKAMEDHKDNLVIILAGYRREMDHFLKTNPGLASRFAIQLDFPDYSLDELIKIAELMYAEKEYILDQASKHYIYRALTKLRSKEVINGNARTVRNLVEKSIRRHASRVINIKNIDRNSLMYITREDLLFEEEMESE